MKNVKKASLAMSVNVNSPRETSPVATLQEADARFTRALGTYNQLKGKVKGAAWEGIAALAEVFKVAVDNGVAPGDAWKHLDSLLANEDKTVRSEWKRAAHGIYRGEKPEADEKLEKFASRCGKPEFISGKQGGDGPRELTDARRAKGLRSMATKADALSADADQYRASKAVREALKVLRAALAKDAEQAEAEVAAKAAAKA